MIYSNGFLETEFHQAQLGICYAPVAINGESTTMVGTGKSLGYNPLQSTNFKGSDVHYSADMVPCK